MKESQALTSKVGRQYLLLADEDLISLVDKSDSAAFEVLYDRHSLAAYSVAYRIVGQQQAAEDLVQEAFLNVWRLAGSYRPARGSVRNWIFSIVHHRGVDRLRHATSRTRMEEKLKAAPDAGVQHGDAFTETWRNFQQEQVRRALGVLPPEQLEVLELSYFSGFTHMEIAELLDLPLGTVKGRMRMGIKKMKDHFEPREAVMPDRTRRGAGAGKRSFSSYPRPVRRGR